jgi:hypothetical protein
MSINLSLRLSGQHFMLLVGSGGEESVKLTPDGDEAGRPISMVLSKVGRLNRWNWIASTTRIGGNKHLPKDTC